MSLRPTSATWFELLTSREELGSVLEGLAQTGAVQLETRSSDGERLEFAGLRELLEEYSGFARRYLPWWPAAVIELAPPESALLDRPREALQRFKAWASAAEAQVSELESIARDREALAQLERLLLVAGSALPRLDLLADPGPVLATRAYLLPAALPDLQLPAESLSLRMRGEADDALLVVGPAAQLAALDAALSLRRAQRIALPIALPAAAAALQAELAARRRGLEVREAAARARLEIMDRQHANAEARGTSAIATRLLAHVPELAVTEHFAWVTGWCSGDGESTLRSSLDARGLHYLLLAQPAPRGSIPPSLLDNPRWAQPFEMLTGLMGTPGPGEADPSSVVALLAPLMFGFMFGDLAQGAILALVGAVLGRRIPALRLLLPGGLVAMVFGLAFGSVFAREDLLPALWLHPLAQPLAVLGVALGFGVVVIVLGVLLDALQHHWRGALPGWLARDAGVLLAYLGLVFAPFESRALWATLLGVAWVLIGSGVTAERHWQAVGAAAGELVERLLQLLVNTVSFVRVGAFALAHAGLCSAVVGIAEASGPGYWPVLVLGNAAILAIEGLVVGIQTTRLILFEFFIRFLSVRGRRFEPLPPPAASLSPLPGHRP